MSEEGETEAAPAAEEEKKDAVEGGGEEVGGGELVGVPDKVDVQKRAIAGLIDIGGASIAASAVAAIGGMIPFIGGIVGALGFAAAAGYIALRDSINNGQSFGKQQVHLKVTTASGGPPTQEESLKRNAVLAAPMAIMAVGMACTIIPILGHMVMIFVAAPLAGLVSLVGLYEAAQVVALDPKGRRLMELKAEAYTVEE